MTWKPQLSALVFALTVGFTATTGHPIDYSTTGAASVLTITGSHPIADGHEHVWTASITPDQHSFTGWVVAGDVRLEVRGTVSGKSVAGAVSANQSQLVEFFGEPSEDEDLVVHYRTVTGSSGVLPIRWLLDSSAGALSAADTVRLWDTLTHRND